MHMGATSILIDLPVKGDHLENFASILNRLLSQHFPHLKIILRLTVPSDEHMAEKLFRRYTDFKQLIDGCANVNLLIAMEADIPDENFFLKFSGEKLHGVQLSTSAFISN